MRTLDDEIELDKKFKHDIAVVVDRLVMKDGLRRRLTDSVETAAHLADGLVDIELADGPTLTFSEKFACLHCGISMPEIQPRIFSFNNPHGACPACHGLGSTQEIDPDLVVPDHALSISQGALLPFGLATGWMEETFQAVIERYHVDPDAPWRDLPAEQRDLFLMRHARPHRHALPQLRGALAALQGPVPRHPRQPAAALRRDRIRPHPPEDRGVHERAPVRGVPRRAPQADQPRGHRRRAQHLPSSPS